MQCTLKGKVPILKLDLMVEKGEWREVLQVLRAINNYSQKFMFVFCSRMGFIVSFFKNEYLEFFIEFPKISRFLLKN
jgi:hypothetical protein